MSVPATKLPNQSIHEWGVSPTGNSLPSKTPHRKENEQRQTENGFRSQTANGSRTSVASETTSELTLRKDFNRDVWCLLGLPFDAVNMQQTQERLADAVDSNERIVLATPNVNILLNTIKDATFRRNIVDSELLVLDGMPLVWIAQILGLPFSERVPGSGMIERMKYTDRRWSLFLFGGKPGVAQTAARRINERQDDRKGLRAVGYCDPGVVDPEGRSASREHIDSINKSRADILLVALGAMKGQAWINNNKNRLHATVISHLGATINFLAGTVKRAPNWIQRFGLEWLWRIYEEPSLWKRYLPDAFKLAYITILYVIPYRQLIRQAHKTENNLGSLTINTHEEANTVHLSLVGVATCKTSGDVKNALYKAVLTNKNISVDLSKVRYIDAAFIGALIVAEKYMRRADRSIQVKGTSKLLKRIFRYNFSSHLLQNSQAENLPNSNTTPSSKLIGRVSPHGKPERPSHAIFSKSLYSKSKES